MTVTADRLTEVLRAEGHAVDVTDLAVEPVGTGQMAGSLRLTPTYAGPTDLPATFVAKVPGGNPEARATAAGAYRTEVGFYRRLAPTLAVRVPQCFHAWSTDDGTDFLLLLEDVAPATQGDQVAGCTLAQATTAAVNLAGLHGPRWCDPTLADDGLEPLDAEAASILGEVMTPMTERFLAHFADLGEAHREVLASVPDVSAAWLTARSERFGPVHGDYRLDNLLFAPDGTVTAVDWQTVSLGLPARDLAFLLSTGLPIEERRAGEDAVVAAYHDALVGFGVTGHPIEECADDYRFGLLQAPLIIVLGWAVAAPTARGDAMFRAMAERSCQAIADHGTLTMV